MANEMSALIGAELTRMQGEAQTLTAPLVNPLTTPTDGEMSFGASLQMAVSGVNDKERVAAQRMADVDSGRSDDLVGAMLASQDASLSFSMLMQVRNKVVGAMDELIKLQL